MSVPESFLCPISQQVMVDPYIDTDGNSYERSAIMEWLATRQVSPITRRPLKPGDLVPNRVLKTLIEEYKNSSGTFNTARGAEEEAAAPLDRKPLMLLAVIDNSGSMGESCGNNPTGEDDGFSRLDLVKHTMNTIITALAPQDKICLIKFSNSAEVIANLTSLTPTSKKFLMQTMQDLVPEYSTNIWDGLRAALDIVASLPASTVEEYNIQVFLLTDGVPNMNPPRPITETLETYLKKKCAGRRPQVHTFGYGYSLQSDVLYELAKVANGCFGFIPDSSMVGTVFINSLSSTLVGADPSMSNATIDAVADKFCTLLRALLAEPVCQDFVQQDNQLRAFVADVEGQLAEARADGSDARAIDFLESLLLDCKGSSDPNLGQVAKAVQPQFCRKWGKHYLYSVLSAFEHRVCINFKDKAMQIFKSERFKIEQERVEEVFLTLPAPKPHASNNQQYGSQYASRAAAAPASMANYHTAHGGCFTGDSVVLAVREERVVPVLVRDLRPEDTVLSQLGATQVECIVKLRYNGPVFQVENMKLTAYHPVMLGARDLFPIEVCAGAATAHCPDYVYDLVLRNRGLVVSPRQSLSGTRSGYECMYAATFGHTVVQGRFAHAYFGSERVVQDLKAHPSWATGRIVLEEYEFVREADGARRVVGMKLLTTSRDTHGVEGAQELDTAVVVTVV